MPAVVPAAVLPVVGLLLEGPAVAVPVAVGPVEGLDWQLQVWGPTAGGAVSEYPCDRWGRSAAAGTTTADMRHGRCGRMEASSHLPAHPEHHQHFFIIIFKHCKLQYIF